MRGGLHVLAWWRGVIKERATRARSRVAMVNRSEVVRGKGRVRRRERKRSEEKLSEAMKVQRMRRSTRACVVIVREQEEYSHSDRHRIKKEEIIELKKNPTRTEDYLPMLSTILREGVGYGKGN